MIGDNRQKGLAGCMGSMAGGMVAPITRRNAAACPWKRMGQSSTAYFSRSQYQTDINYPLSTLHVSKKQYFPILHL